MGPTPIENENKLLRTILPVAYCQLSEDLHLLWWRTPEHGIYLSETFRKELTTHSIALISGDTPAQECPISSGYSFAVLDKNNRLFVLDFAWRQREEVQEQWWTLDNHGGLLLHYLHGSEGNQRLELYQLTAVALQSMISPRDLLCNPMRHIRNTALYRSGVTGLRANPAGTVMYTTLVEDRQDPSQTHIHIWFIQQQNGQCRESYSCWIDPIEALKGRSKVVLTSMSQTDVPTLVFHDLETGETLNVPITDNEKFIQLYRRWILNQWWHD